MVNHVKTIGSDILVVDDDLEVAITLQKLLESVNHNVVISRSAEQAIEACRSRPFKLVISDMRMPGMSGASLFRELARNHPTIRRVILTVYLDVDEIMAAINFGRIHRYLIKPIKPEAMIDAISEELSLADGEEITRLRRELDQLTEQN